MSEETKGLLGQFAFELLKDDRYTALKQMFGQQMAVDILNTAPNETKKREYLHASYNGFGEFERLMQSFADHYERTYLEPHAAPTENIED